MKSVINGETIYFVGGYYEKKGSEITKYYGAGASRIAVRKYLIPQYDTLNYILGDHLGSTSITVDADTGNKVETRYKPWGEVRYTTEDLTEPIEEITLPTRYTFTGQYSDSYINLLDYGFRRYDPELGRFISPDSIIPDPNNPQAWDRYGYVLNNPVRYTDPTGHKTCYNLDEDGDCKDTEEEQKADDLFDYIDRSIMNQKGRVKSSLTSLQAMLMIVKYAAYIYGNDWNGFLNATSLVFMGVYQHGAGAMLAAHRSGNSGFINGSSGFHSDFVDNSSQVRHFWAAFATAADPYGDNPYGVAFAEFGNYYHEVMSDWTFKEGTTIIDYELSVTGIDIAMQVGNSIATPMELANILLFRLGVAGPGYIGPEFNAFPGFITPYQ